jgi:hypothetical protein
MSNEAWLADHRRIAIGKLIDRRPFTTAAKLEANQKIDLARPRADSSFFIHTVATIGEWAIKQDVSMLTAVPTGATRYARAAAKVHNIPFVTFRKRHGEFEAYVGTLDGLDILNSDDESALVGMVEDVCSTRYSLARLAAKIRQRKTGLAIVDRGDDVSGVATLEQAQAYSREYPYLPPAHIKLPFPYESLISYPLALKST